MGSNPSGNPKQREGGHGGKPKPTKAVTHSTACRYRCACLAGFESYWDWLEHTNVCRKSS